jgi:ribonuclease P protein component
MLKKRNRLSKPFAKKNALNFSSSLFNIKIYDSSEEVSRFAFIVSKKISRSAVLRNKTKRVLAKAAEETIKKIKETKDIVIIAKKQLEFSQTNNAKEALEEVFRKAKIL